MSNNCDFIAMVPARIGSTRLKCKNLALLNGKPLISYPIEAAKKSNVFSKIVLNGDNPCFADIAARHDVEFYKRPSHLGSSEAMVDDVVFDFLSKHDADYVAWVNPTSPLQTAGEIRNVINYFLEEKLDSLVTVRHEKVHCIYENKPVNFSMEEVFGRTQDIVPVQSFVYSVVAWKRRTFMETFAEKGYAFFCGKVGYYPVSRETSFIIKTIKDLMFVDYFIKAKESSSEYKIEYDNLMRIISKGG